MSGKFLGTEANFKRTPQKLTFKRVNPLTKFSNKGAVFFLGSLEV